MKKSRITIYDPSLSVEENALMNDVAVPTMRHHIRVKGIDRYSDNLIRQYHKIKKYQRENPKDKAPQIAKALNLSANTVRKYLKMTEPPKPREKKVSTINKAETLRFLSVSDNQYDILKAILAIHLKNSDTFQCDLTAWRCGFYKHGIKVPPWLFDKYPQMDGVRKLSDLFDKSIDIRLEGVFSSVVVDLPTSVSDSTSNKDIDIATEFSSMEELHEVNSEMLVTAHRIMQTDGILVFKTMDFTYRNTPRWISDYVIKTAYNIGFELLDKFIYVDPKHNKIDRRRTRFTASVPAHAYFFVFRKVYKPRS